MELSKVLAALPAKRREKIERRAAELVPNAKTVKAMEEARKGGLKPFDPANPHL